MQNFYCDHRNFDSVTPALSKPILLDTVKNIYASLKIL